GEPWVQGYGLIIVCQSFFQAAPGHECVAPAAVRFRESGIEGYRSIIVCQSLVDAPSGLECVAPGTVCRRVPRVDLDSGSEIRYGFIKSTPGILAQAPIVVSEREFRIKSYGCIVVGNGFVQIPFSIETIAAREVGLRKIGSLCLNRQGAQDETNNQPSIPP